MRHLAAALLAISSLLLVLVSLPAVPAVAGAGAGDAAAAGISTVAQLPDTGFAVGTPFPTLELPRLQDGELTSIAAFRGKPIILHVFASW